MKLSFPHIQGSVFFLDEARMSEGCAAARVSPRRRIILPMHRQPGDPVQRLLNFLQPGTYITPHYHPQEGFSETVHVLQGAILFLEFSPSSEIVGRKILRAGRADCLVDFVGDCIHSFVCLELDTVVLEIKKGPYIEGGDKVFMPWAPPENDPAAVEYRESLERFSAS